MVWTTIATASSNNTFDGIDALYKERVQGHMCLAFDSATRLSSLSSKELSLLLTRLGKAPNITHLHLGENAISSLPRTISAFSSLQHLDVQGNHLTTLPVEVGSLVDIRKIGLHGNKLQHLPQSMSSLTQLSDLNLMYNKGKQNTAVPEEYDTIENVTLAIPNLEKIEVSYSNLTLSKGHRSCEEMNDTFEDADYSDDGVW